jgi:hypothetical protein
MPKVSDREREYMRRIGEYKEASHRDATERHLALPIEERLARSWDLYLAGRAEASPDLRDDDPTPFYDRARALGLYEP